MKNIRMRRSAFVLGLCLLTAMAVAAPQKKQPATAQPTVDEKMFTRLDSGTTGINFANISAWESIEGGGVAIGDLNNDGLPEIFFGGTEVPDRLYLNLGNMQFKDISDILGAGRGQYSTGVTMADVNNDGFLDLYVCKLKNQNTLYLNNGDLTFLHQTNRFGIGHNGQAVQSAFFDYDKDGRLDLIVAIRDNSGIDATLKTVGARIKRNEKYAHRLYHQNSSGTFEDVSRKAGILNDSIGVSVAYSVAISDLNGDGWEDIYITSDYDSPDLLYINNGDGTFSERASSMFKHTSFYAMGVDIADMNNDGLPDILTLDMRPESNFRQKTSMWETPFDWDQLVNNPTSAANRQYVRNTLQINTGLGTFSELGELAGVDATEWSWAPLLADFDNDGFKDIFITNGNFRDVTMNTNYPLLYDSLISLYGSTRRNISPKDVQKQIVRMLPQPVFTSYLYRNKGDLTFSNIGRSWGIDSACISNGAAYADLDNDGDLDIVVNNINRPAFIYRNNAEKLHNNFLRIALHRDSGITIGTKVTIWTKNGMQMVESYPTRGFFSSSETVLHFGLGNASGVDSLLVQWPDGRSERLKALSGNRKITLDYLNATTPGSEPKPLPTLFRDITRSSCLPYIHKENTFTDFVYEPLLPHQFSSNGPGMAVADVNGDGLDDIFFGGTSARPGVLYLQTSSGIFTPADSQPWEASTGADDMGCLFLDVDGDGDNDLLLARGGSEFPDGASQYKSSLYLNDGKGTFASKEDALPDITTSCSVVCSADFNNDGLPDLFIGGRVSAQQYPVSPRSYLLQNTGGAFKDVTAELAPTLLHTGMITCALWSDYDNDGKLDLIVAGEWLPLTFLRNNEGKFSNETNRAFSGSTTGWWNSIIGGDFDNDGDIDYIAGNLGLNTRFKASADAPLRLFATDIDKNGSTDLLMSFDENGKSYPVKQLKTLAVRINGLAKKYRDPISFGTATIQDLIPPARMDSTLQLSMVETASCYIENLGNGTFSVRRLPNEAQVAPVYGLLSGDFNNDGFLDVLLTGNFYETEVERGRYDASTGLLLTGNGKGSFTASPSRTNGFFVDGNARSLVSLMRADSTLLVVAAQNNNWSRIFETSVKQRYVTPGKGETTALLLLNNGSRRKVEMYNGSGYLSQNTTKLPIGATVKEVKFQKGTAPKKRK